MPAISAGIFGFPKADCAHIIVGEISSFLGSEKTSLKEIDICLMDADIIGFFEKELELIGLES
jgi:O-acetyl-ADP-ribose deacetylase (regulator of RNase III)